MKRRTPHFPLALVKGLAALPDGLFIQRTRAVDFFTSHAEAYAAARRVIEGPTESDFSETLRLTHDVADVYGVRIEDVGWYLKMTVDETVPEVAVISSHPLERPIRTNGGTVEP